ncbi:MAG TPA: hypothetical protein PLV25_07040, partial [Opitutales bacterium]|nr:hypothetical protein [Opitutales bacterium]
SLHCMDHILKTREPVESKKLALSLGVVVGSLYLAETRELWSAVAKPWAKMVFSTAGYLESTYTALCPYQPHLINAIYLAVTKYSLANTSWKECAGGWLIAESTYMATHMAYKII